LGLPAYSGVQKSCTVNARENRKREEAATSKWGKTE